MKWPILLIGLWALVILQTSALPAFDLFGVGPNLLLVVLCCWVSIREVDEGMILIPLAGIGIGLLSFEGMSISVAAFAPIVLLAALRERLGVSSEYLWTLAVVIAATIMHFVVIAVGLQVDGASIDWVAAVTDILLPAILGNFLLALAVYWLVRLPTSQRLGAV